MCVTGPTNLSGRFVVIVICFICNAKLAVNLSSFFYFRSTLHHQALPYITRWAISAGYEATIIRRDYSILITCTVAGCIKRPNPENNQSKYLQKNRRMWAEGFILLLHILYTKSIQRYMDTISHHPGICNFIANYTTHQFCIQIMLLHPQILKTEALDQK